MANTVTVRFDDGREACFSYGVLVAAFVPGRGFLHTDKRYSVTTSKHMNAFCDRRGQEIADSELRALVAPVESAKA